MVKGPFSIWALFGLTLWIDILSHIFYWEKKERVNPYEPLREVSVIVPVHNEHADSIKRTVGSILNERYPVKNIILVGDVASKTGEYLNKLVEIDERIYFLEPPHTSKAMRINWVMQNFSDILGELSYIRDCGSISEIDCMEKMVSYFSYDKVGAVTSYGRVTIPKNFLSRSYHYGKAWINEIGRFRKNAQEKRGAVFVICGATTMFKTELLRKFPVPSTTKTEDTYYTWLLQKKGYDIRVADDATVSANEIDGEKFDGLNRQIKQSYRWSTGTIQCMYKEGRGIFKNKKLAFTTILPGFLEALMYSLPFVFIPVLYFLSPEFFWAFVIGDTVFSLLGTLIIIPEKFLKTLYHYPQIVFFKYINCAIFLIALFNMTVQAMFGETKEWLNEWKVPELEGKVV